MANNRGPKILVVDIESAPIVSYTWGLFDQNVGLNQIKQDWYILSWSAKWLGEDKVMYQDLRGKERTKTDKSLLKGIWDLLNEADIVVGQNSKRFDVKKLNARFVLNGFQPPSVYKQIDTLVLAKKHFAFTSNKLEYMTDKLCTTHKKIKHVEFGGFELWKECLAGNKKAWAQMEAYNKADVLSTEELYTKLIPWDSSLNFNIYRPEGVVSQCSCGSVKLNRRGYYYTSVAKYQKWRCMKCGKETYAGKNLLELKHHKGVVR